MATALITGAPMTGIGQPGDIDLPTTTVGGTGARNTVGTRVKGQDTSGYSAEYIYLIGCASTIAGSVVTYDNTGQTALIVADASGPVAVATAAVLAGQWGWYCIQGYVLVDVVANSAAAATTAKNPGRETTDGKVGDGRAAGDEINNFFQRVATTTAALALCQIDHPFVNNATGA